jgi:hypothetical protein
MAVSFPLNNKHCSEETMKKRSAESLEMEQDEQYKLQRLEEEDREFKSFAVCFLSCAVVSEYFYSLRSEIDRLSDQIQSMGSKTLTLQTDLRSLEASIATAKDTTIPQLENEKAIAVKNKNFKGAKVAQDEIKKHQTLLEDNEKSKAATIASLESVKKVLAYLSCVL